MTGLIFLFFFKKGGVGDVVELKRTPLLSQSLSPLFDRFLRRRFRHASNWRLEFNNRSGGDFMGTKSKKKIESKFTHYFLFGMF